MYPYDPTPNFVPTAPLTITDRCSPADLDASRGSTSIDVGSILSQAGSPSRPTNGYLPPVSPTGAIPRGGL